MAKYLAQMLLSISRILGRAFAKALQEEYAASKNAARVRADTNKSSSESDFVSSLSGISLEEAKQILNVSDIHNADEVSRKYDYLFNINDKKNGGSLYLQSKVFRAKERIDEELQAKSSSSNV